MVCKMFLAPNSLIFRKCCGEEEKEEREKAIAKRYAFQANAINV